MMLTSLRAKKGPVVTFYCSHDNGQRVEKLRTNQAFFFRDSVSNVPQLIEQSEGEEDLYDFRELIEAEPEKDAEAEWEAFGSFKSWLDTGVYVNKQITGTHLDAYILAEKLQSTAFKNAVMKKMLEMMPAKKYDEDLKDAFRNIFACCSRASPLRELYFQSASFWNFGFEEGPYFQRGLTGDLGLNPVSDRWLIHALKGHKERFCSCPIMKEPTEQGGRNSRNSQHRRPPPTLRHTSRQVCNCEKAPWKQPNQFYQVG